jgi:hypothetical protein
MSSEVAAALQKAVLVRDEAGIKAILDTNPGAEILNTQDAHGYVFFHNKYIE